MQLPDRLKLRHPTLEADGKPCPKRLCSQMRQLSRIGSRDLYETAWQKSSANRLKPRQQNSTVQNKRNEQCQVYQNFRYRRMKKAAKYLPPEAAIVNPSHCRTAFIHPGTCKPICIKCSTLQDINKFLFGSLSCKNNNNCFNQDLNIQPQRPVINILCV